MKALDQVSKYRALTKLIVDFAIIMLVSIAGLLTLELGVNFYQVGTSFPCYYSSASSFICVASSTSMSVGYESLAALSLLLIPAAGLLIGIVWVDRRLKSVKGGAWRESLNEGFPGALKLLQGLNWDSVFEDIRLSRIGYAVYFMIKITGYWIFAFIVLVFPYTLGVSALHAYPNLYLLAFVSLALVLLLNRDDLQRKYNQVVSLDTLMWDLRWFSSEFRAAKFEA